MHASVELNHITSVNIFPNCTPSGEIPLCVQRIFWIGNDKNPHDVDYATDDENNEEEDNNANPIANNDDNRRESEANNCDGNNRENIQQVQDADNIHDTHQIEPMNEENMEFPDYHLFNPRNGMITTSTPNDTIIMASSQGEASIVRTSMDTSIQCGASRVPAATNDNGRPGRETVQEASLSTAMSGVGTPANAAAGPSHGNDESPVYSSPSIEILPQNEGEQLNLHDHGVQRRGTPIPRRL